MSAKSHQQREYVAAGDCATAGAESCCVDLIPVDPVNDKYDLRLLASLDPDGFCKGAAVRPHASKHGSTVPAIISAAGAHAWHNYVVSHPYCRVCRLQHGTTISAPAVMLPALSVKINCKLLSHKTVLSACRWSGDQCVHIPGESACQASPLPQWHSWQSWQPVTVLVALVTAAVRYHMSVYCCSGVLTQMSYM